ncbi:MAG: hypothetical protein RIQ75_1148 [Pseudomonadota bacterium]
MTAYYNEIDPKAAAWLRELIKQGHIADGDVDDRSIEDVRPVDLLGFDQCHFFAGIGVWSYALRRSGWADDRAVWTGSCPCQPFSAAGKGSGFADERHLWPAFHHLISQCRPDVVLGEQVASKDGLAWLDLVHADLEATGYASGAVDLCAAGVGAPHIRQRLWWVGTRLADTDNTRRQLLTDAKPAGVCGEASGKRQQVQQPSTNGTSDGSMADASITGLQGREWIGPTGTKGRPSGYSAECSGPGGMADTSADGSQGRVSGRSDQGRETVHGSAGCDGANCGLADASSGGRSQFSADNDRGAEVADGQQGRRVSHAARCGEVGGGSQRPGPTNGHWRDADWLFCRDGKWRPVEPGTSPLAHGAAARVGRLRGYGNAIVAQAAQAFIESVM